MAFYWLFSKPHDRIFIHESEMSYEKQWELEEMGYMMVQEHIHENDIDQYL